MARDHARVYVSIWADPAFRKLDRHPQRMYLLLASQANLTYCGSLDYLPGRWETLSADEDEASVTHAVKVLEAERFVVVDRTTHELLIRSFVRHDGLLDSPNMTKAMLKARAAMLSDELRDVVDRELSRAYREKPSAKGWTGKGGFKDTDLPLFEAITSKGSRKGSRKGEIGDA